MTSIFKLRHFWVYWPEFINQNILFNNNVISYNAFQWTKWLKKLSVFKIMVTSMEQLQLEEDSSCGAQPSFPNQTINLPLIHDTRRISDDSNGGNLSLKKGPMCKIKNYNKKIMIHFLIVKNHNSFFNCKKWQLKNVIWRILRGLNTR